MRQLGVNNVGVEVVAVRNSLLQQQEGLRLWHVCDACRGGDEEAQQGLNRGRCKSDSGRRRRRGDRPAQAQDTLALPCCRLFVPQSRLPSHLHPPSNWLSISPLSRIRRLEGDRKWKVSSRKPSDSELQRAKGRAVWMRRRAWGRVQQLLTWQQGTGSLCLDGGGHIKGERKRPTSHPCPQLTSQRLRSRFD